MLLPLGLSKAMAISFGEVFSCHFCAISTKVYPIVSAACAG